MGGQENHRGKERLGADELSTRQSHINSDRLGETRQVPNTKSLSLCYLSFPKLVGKAFIYTYRFIHYSNFIYGWLFITG